MCKAIEEYGERQRLEEKRNMAISLDKQGVAVEIIAKAAGVARETVESWLVPQTA